MCSPTRCATCGDKITWSGCGSHIASVRAMVPADQWCPGHPKAERQGTWLDRLRGR